METWIKNVIKDNSSTIEVNGSRRIGKTTCLAELSKYHSKILYIGKSISFFNTFVKALEENNKASISKKNPHLIEYMENGIFKQLLYQNYKEIKELLNEQIISQKLSSHGSDINLVVFEEVNPADEEIDKLRSVLRYHGQVYIVHTTPPRRKIYNIKYDDLDSMQMPDLDKFSKKTKKEFTLEPDVWEVKNGQALNFVDFKHGSFKFKS